MFLICTIWGYLVSQCFLIVVCNGLFLIPFGLSMAFHIVDHSLLNTPPSFTPFLIFIIIIIIILSLLSLQPVMVIQWDKGCKLWRVGYLQGGLSLTLLGPNITTTLHSCSVPQPRFQETSQDLLRERQNIPILCLLPSLGAILLHAATPQLSQ